VKANGNGKERWDESLNLQQSDHEVDAQCPILMLNSNISFVPVDPRLKFFHPQNSLALDFLEDTQSESPTNGMPK